MEPRHGRLHRARGRVGCKTGLGGGWGVVGREGGVITEVSPAAALPLPALSHQSGIRCWATSLCWIQPSLITPPTSSSSSLSLSQLLWIGSVSFSIDCIIPISHLSGAAIAGAPEAGRAKNRHTQATFPRTVFYCYDQGSRGWVGGLAVMDENSSNW